MKNRSHYIFILLISSILFAGCRASYRQETLNPGDFYSNTQVQRNIGYYDVYVHDGQNSYMMSAPAVSGDTLKGIVLKVDPASIVPRPKGKKETAKHRKEINVYLKKPIDPATLNAPVIVTKADIDRADVYAKNRKSLFAIFAGIALIVVLVGALIYGLVVLAVKGSDESSNGSDDSSGDSSKGSGCYVATMVYGSYEAPEVLVLRRFRDNFLAKYSWGRSFIKWYYANSPAFVERYKNSPAINKMIRFVLNRLVKLLS